MTSQATFGDLLDAARAHLTAVARPTRAPAGGEDLREAGQSTRSLLQVLRRYTHDITTGFGTEPHHRHEPETPWDQALADTQRELARAAAILTPPASIRGNPGARPAVTAASRIDQAAALLRAGRELLDTHFQSRTDGSRAHHTEWAPALASPPGRRALLAEVAAIAQLTAVTSDQLAQAPGWRGAPGPRRALAEASQSLHALDRSFHAAQQHQPVPAADRDLLRAARASMLPPRRLPESGTSVTSLCHGAITSAQRLRRAAWQSASEPSPSSATITSLRQIAAASTVTSHHCELLLRATAERAEALFPTPEASEDMLQAAETAARASASWLTLARTLDRFTTQSRESVSPAAAEAPSLATWTGRLVYADATWILASGPAHQHRPADTLAPHLADIPLVIATVHYAADALEAAADAEHDQAHKTARAGKLLVPTRSLPRPAGTQPLTPAPGARVRDLLRAYRAAGQATADTVTRLATVAASVDSPSRILTSASASTAAGIDHDKRWRRVPDVIPATEPSWPGPLETSIRDLGITSPWLIQRAITLDRASAQLILDAAVEPEASHKGTAAATLTKPATTGAIVTDIVASGDPRADAMRRPEPPQHAGPDREP
ncbi:MAG: hypothetical protein ACRDNZ_23250 [Streptosporangiaceae bacterium]